MSVGSIEASNKRPVAFEQTAPDEKYRKAAYVFIGLLTVYVVVRGVRAASPLPFWMDEFYTLAIAGQPTIHDLWTLCNRGIDTTPPFFFLIERLTLSLPIQKEVALRLPSILAFPCILICVFTYVRRRSGELIGCLCALLFLSTTLFHTYLIDARPYVEPVACLSFALLCYQRLPSPRWTVLFAVSLVLAESFHYYSVFAMLPFWFAEGVFLLRTRRFRWHVWLALFSGFLPLIPALPLLWSVRSALGPHIFSRPVLAVVRGYYGEFFLLQDYVLGMALAVVAAAATAWFRLWGQQNDSPHLANEQRDVPEGVLVLSLIALPYIAFVLARVTHGVLIPRYVMATIIGVAVGLGCGLSIAGRKATVIFAIFVFCVVGLREYSFWRIGHPVTAEVYVTSKEQLVEIQELIQSGGHPDLPVVFDQDLVYCQIAYYGSPDWTKRLVFLTDEGREFRSGGTDTGVRLNRSLSNFYALRLQDYSQFTAKYSEFLLYAEPQGWILNALRDEGNTVQVLKVDGDRWLYLVKMKNASPE